MPAGQRVSVSNPEEIWKGDIRVYDSKRSGNDVLRKHPPTLPRGPCCPIVCQNGPQERWWQDIRSRKSKIWATEANSYKSADWAGGTIQEANRRTGKEEKRKHWRNISWIEGWSDRINWCHSKTKDNWQNEKQNWGDDIQKSRQENSEEEKE